ncbi:MAG: dTDP-4-amino-4,6-dideoxygalactose transaminase [Verrucomicrobiales bacterium]
MNTTPDGHLPFCRPHKSGKELEYIRQCLDSGHLAGDAAFTKACHRWLEEKTGAAKALMTTSCTAALEMCSILLEVGRDTEVIVPSFTFVSSANAFALFGANIRFADVREDTLTIDWETVEPHLTDRTRSVVLVHYAGITSDPDVLAHKLAERGIPLVEDNAHGLLGTWDGKPLGSFGALATQSFHESKNFSCGEGGALLVNDTQYQARAEILREKGTNRSAFFRREIGKYSWVDVGSSYLASDVLAALLLAQFEEADVIQQRRHAIWQRYHDSLGAWAAANGVRLPHVPAKSGPSWHLFQMILPDTETRERAILWFRQAGIEVYFHYLPLHLSPMGQQHGGREGQCPVSEKTAQCLLRLPLYPGLSDADQERVIARLLDFKC